MNKTLLTLALAVSGFFCANAQDKIFDNPDNKPYFGARFSIDIDCPTKMTAKVYDDNHITDIKSKVFKTGGGFELGGIYHYPIIANFYVEPGLGFYYNAYNFDEAFKEEQKGSIRKFGMAIPVMLGYHFDFTDDIKVSVFTGPELDVAFSGKAHWNEGDHSVYTNVYRKDGELHRANLLWDFGAGVSYQKFYFAVSGGPGLCNMSKVKGTSFHEGKARLTFGYNF